MATVKTPILLSRALINSGTVGFSKAPEETLLGIYEYQARFAIGKCYSARINTGPLGVPWEKTKDVLKKGKVDITVMKPLEKVAGDTRKQTSEGLEDHGLSGVEEEANGLKRS
ncbi:MAG: hypothetical protein Q9179_005261 [Wetmoreana sp. 5 TL-2023]